MLATLLALSSSILPQGSTGSPVILPPNCLRVIDAHHGKVFDVDISADGERVFVGCEDGHVLVLALLTGEQLGDLFDQAGSVLDVQLDPRGERLASVQSGRTTLWNAKTFAKEHVLSGQKLGMLRARFSPDGSSLATGACGDGSKMDEPTEVRVWEAATGKQIALFDDAGYRALPTFSRDGKTVLLSAESKNVATVFQLDDQHVVAKLSGHDLGIASSAWSPDGKAVLTVSADLTGRLWNASTGKQMQVLHGHTGYVTMCEFSADGKDASTTSWIDLTTRVWNASTGKQRLMLKGHDERPTVAHFSPDGRAFASADAAGHAIVFELGRGKIAAKLDGHSGVVTALEFTPDSKRIVTCGYDGSVRVWANPLAK